MKFRSILDSFEVHFYRRIALDPWSEASLNDLQPSKISRGCWTNEPMKWQLYIPCRRVRKSKNRNFGSVSKFFCWCSIIILRLSALRSVFWRFWTLDELFNPERSKNRHFWVKMGDIVVLVAKIFEGFASKSSFWLKTVKKDYKIVTL